MLKQIALTPGVNKEDIPKTLVVISDMQIDCSGTSNWTRGRYERMNQWTTENTATEMEKLREEWAADGLELPRLVYWNVNASKNTVLDKGPYVSFVSGASPIIFEQVIKGVTGYHLMLDKLMSDRYAVVK